jgi:GNAT superfamily N-acetyltransferase
MSGFKMFKLVNREEILREIVPDEKNSDGFARVLVNKCDTYGLWDRTYGYFVNDKLVGVIVTTYSKRSPKTANLQLLFTYHIHRGNGYARDMVLKSIEQAYENGCEYYRISSEKKALPFYDKLGIKFFCEQKSGTQLSIFKVNDTIINEKDFELDEKMEKMYFRKGKGGCVKVLGEYTKDDLSFGAELEFSNIPKSKEIPADLGQWEYSELDIINTKGEFANICADPRGVEPPVGGEINTIPSKNFVDQVDKIMQIIELFENDDIDIGITAHTHIHVHVDGLEEDMEALRRLLSYIYDNQEIAINACYKYNEKIIPEDKQFSKIRRYLKFDGGRPLPEWFKNNILEHSNDFTEFSNSSQWGIKKYPIKRYQRYYVNLHSLRTSKTIEFRCFRGTLNKQEYLDMFAFAQEFILNALNGGKSVIKILEENDYSFPVMKFDPDQALGWEATKYGENRCINKNRTFWDAEKSSDKTYEVKKKEKILGDLHLINYMGANGVGKSTRAFHLVEYLKEVFDYKEFNYNIIRKGKEEKEETIGLLFENGWLVLGKFSKDDTQWVSLDSAILSKWEQRIAFIEDMTSRDEIKTVFMEGYFNNRSMQSSPENLHAHGVTQVDIITSYYDDISEFIERTNGRTGKNRGLEWAEQSPGWNDNKLFDKLYHNFIKEVQDTDKVIRLDIHAPREALVHLYFDEGYTKKVENNSVEEWL